jgi:hypothetical protein
VARRVAGVGSFFSFFQFSAGILKVLSSYSLLFSVRLKHTVFFAFSTFLRKLRRVVYSIFRVRCGCADRLFARPNRASFFLLGSDVHVQSASEVTFLSYLLSSFARHRKSRGQRRLASRLQLFSCVATSAASALLVGVRSIPRRSVRFGVSG